ncbi:MAG: 2,3-bisphosphoglycerate-independent phosphoglycerate mutase [Alphaproteobacteria bacterium]|nr:2,3-bisphosphoglycerate-independent phosphoglycerate mutase [Alphaproteobacteria bacterium]
MSTELLPAPRGPVVLCILDGVGLGTGGEDDAVATAPTPTLDRLRETCPTVALRAHGTAVGLPSDDDMGNSEVGHNAIGAGRVFDQGAKLVNHALLEAGTAWASDVWKALVGGGTLHLIGLLSDGNVHSHVAHLDALIDRAVHDGVTRLRVHVLTDGRDVGERTALTWVAPLEARLAALAAQGVDASIASGGGRMAITMDRYEADWPMVQRGWEAHVHGQAAPYPSASAAIRAAYEDPAITDQYVPPFVVTGDDGAPVGPIEDGDTVLLFNFRGDRAIELSRAFTEDGFDAFDRGRVPQVYFAGMMQYDGDLALPEHFLVAPPVIEHTVGDVLCAAGKRTFACSETQKFGHVTYFFNGNRSGRLCADLEAYVEVPSDNRPFDEAPWMKAAEIVDACIGAIASGDYDHVRLNLANGDMVGHTGNLAATRVAMACVDLQVARLEKAVRRAGGVMIVTADHGNADEMWQHDKKGQVQRDDAGTPVPRTSHTLAPVPCILVDAEGARSLTAPHGAGIASVGSSLVALLGLAVPDGWAPSLVRI